MLTIRSLLLKNGPLKKVGSLNAVWNNCQSSEFSVKNGVRQGVVISAILFAIYIDELFIILRKSSIGCHTDGVFIGCQWEHFWPTSND